MVPKEIVQKEGPFLSAIADPLADEKLTKKLLKLAKKASKRKQTKRGVKEVVKAIRKKFKGCAFLPESVHHLALGDAIDWRNDQMQELHILQAVPSNSACGPNATLFQLLSGKPVGVWRSLLGWQ